MGQPTHRCNICSRDITRNNFGRHINVCKGLIVPKLLEFKIGDNLYKMPDGFIGTAAQVNCHKTHVRIKNGELNSYQLDMAAGKVKPWNDGLPGAQRHSEDSRKKMSKGCIEKPRGFVVMHNISGHRWSKKIKYIDSFGKDCTLDSTWEWYLANDLDKNGIKWSRSQKFMLPNNRSYTPDFYLHDYDVHLDPKSYMPKDQKERIEMTLELHKIKLIIIDKEENCNWFYARNFII